MPGYQNHAERRFIKVMELRRVRTEYKKYMILIPQEGNRYNAKKFFKTYSSKKTQKNGTEAKIPITTLFNTNQGFAVQEDILSCSSNVNPVTLVAAAPYPRIDDPPSHTTVAAAVDQNISASSPVPDTIQDSLFQAEITLSSQLVDGQQIHQRDRQRVLQRLDLRRIQPKYKRRMKSNGGNNSFCFNTIKFRKIYSNSKAIRLSSNHSDLLSTSMAEIRLSKYTESFITQKDLTLSMTRSMVEEKVSADSTLSFTEVDEVTVDFAIINSSNTRQDSMNEDDSTEHNVDQDIGNKAVIDHSSKEDTIVINQVTVSQVITEFVDVVDEKSDANKPEGPIDAPEPCMIDKNALIEYAIDQGLDAFTITAEVDSNHPKVEQSFTDAPETCIIEEVTIEENLTVTEEDTGYDQSKLEISTMEEINIRDSISIKERILLATPPSSIMDVLYEEKVLIVTPPQSVTNFTTTTVVTVEEEKNSFSPSLTKEGKKNIFSRMFKNKAGTLVPKKMKKMKTTKVWKRLFDASDIFNKQKVK
ncbi:hypothetical protein BD770DRAFT_448472 [Pilaira anomala]|nr:hypothetical protein BD770DRAFT_448472 [Pilaira anomala]